MEASSKRIYEILLNLKIFDLEIRPNSADLEISGKSGDSHMENSELKTLKRSAVVDGGKRQKKMKEKVDATAAKNAQRCISPQLPRVVAQCWEAVRVD